MGSGHGDRARRGRHGQRCRTASAVAGEGYRLAGEHNDAGVARNHALARVARHALGTVLSVEVAEFVLCRHHTAVGDDDALVVTVGNRQVGDLHRGAIANNRTNRTRHPRCRESAVGQANKAHRSREARRRDLEVRRHAICPGGSPRRNAEGPRASEQRRRPAPSIVALSEHRHPSRLSIAARCARLQGERTEPKVIRGVRDEDRAAVGSGSNIVQARHLTDTVSPPMRGCQCDGDTAERPGAGWREVRELRRRRHVRNRWRTGCDRGRHTALHIRDPLEAGVLAATEQGRVQGGVRVAEEADTRLAIAVRMDAKSAGPCFQPELRGVRQHRVATLKVADLEDGAGIAWAAHIRARCASATVRQTPRHIAHV